MTNLDCSYHISIRQIYFAFVIIPVLSQLSLMPKKTKRKFDSSNVVTLKKTRHVSDKNDTVAQKDTQNGTQNDTSLSDCISTLPVDVVVWNDIFKFINIPNQNTAVESDSPEHPWMRLKKLCADGIKPPDPYTLLIDMRYKLDNPIFIRASRLLIFSLPQDNWDATVKEVCDSYNGCIDILWSDQRT